MNLVTEKGTDRRELPICTLCLLLSTHEAGKGITAVDQEETEIDLSIQQVLQGGEKFHSRAGW